MSKKVRFLKECPKRIMQRCVFEDALTEEDDFDLLVMGRTQGKGCYCYVNGLLQAQLAKYQNHYPYIVVDNEAGMEHISRGVLPSMQTAILVSDCSRRGIQAVGRIAKLIDECNMHPETVGLIVNRAPKGELNDGIKEEIEKQGLHLLGVVPQDETVYEYDCEGRPTAALPEDNPVKVALKEIVKKLKSLKRDPCYLLKIARVFVPKMANFFEYENNPMGGDGFCLEGYYIENHYKYMNSFMYKLNGGL